MLSYLIQHLTRVAKHSDKNKMTAVSLSIVFGPNIFPCGSGIEALKLQGYCNSTTCRMVQNYRTLFDRRRGQKRELPAKPQPYSEHKRQKKVITIVYNFVIERYNCLREKVPKQLIGNLLTPSQTRTCTLEVLFSWLSRNDDTALGYACYVTNEGLHCM